MALDLGNLGSSAAYSFQAQGESLQQARQVQAIQLEQQQVQMNQQKMDHEKKLQDKLSDTFSKVAKDQSIAGFEQTARQLNQAAAELRPFDLKAAGDLQLEAERAAQSAKNLKVDAEKAEKDERENRARIATNYNKDDPQSIQEVRSLMEKDNIPIKDQTPKVVETWIKKQQNNAETQEQRDVARAKVEAAALAEQNRRRDREEEDARKLKNSQMLAKGRDALNNGNATEGAYNLYEEFIYAGRPVPKTTRGQVDWEVMNRLAAKEQGGSGSGAVVTAQGDYKAKTSALNANTKDLASIRPYQKMLEKNIDIAINLGQNVVKTNQQWVNKSINWLKENMGDNPDAREYMAQITFVQTEASRVINNPRLVGQLTDSARREMQEVIDGNMPIGSTERVLKRIKADGENRVKAMEAEHDQLTSSLATGAPKNKSNEKQKSGITKTSSGATVSGW